MSNDRFHRWMIAIKLLTAVLIVKVTLTVAWGYRNYWPPNFNSDFLHGREGYFAGAYQWAFYAHIASGPITLLLGLVLLNDRFRLRFLRWHRVLGRIQIATILLLVTPGGLWMAYYAQSGPVAAASFALLAVLTGACAALGWKAAVERRFAVHRRWMWRGYVLLCSAVVLRLLGGLATVSGVQAAWFDPLAAWMCWLVPLAALEGQAYARTATTKRMKPTAHGRT
ncbi:MAG TPA: DUF2306 domain-containing protein [Pirellulales bacterium]